MSYNPNLPAGSALSAASEPVVIASDQAAVAVTVSGVATASNQTGGGQKTQVVPATSGGIPSVATGSIGNVATTVKTTAGQVYGWYFYNNNATMSYVQFFNTVTGSTTVGSTAPVYSLGVPANGGANVFLPHGITHSSAITIAITTTRAGSTSPTNTVDYNVFYD